MIFASDLDRTLIYSKKFINDEITNNHDIKNIEIYNDEEISFILNEGLEILKATKQDLNFVPVTTRTIMQFQRIRFHEHLSPFSYAITSNGGNIIVNGVVDEEYNQRILDTINQGYRIDEMMEDFKQYLYDEEWVTKVRIADDVFFYCVVDETKAPIDKIMDFGKTYVEKRDWRMVKNGRKVYFIPNCVSKGLALKEVADRMGDFDILSAGDSILDIDMLEHSKRFIIPRHGELFDHQVDDDRVTITEQEGLLAGLEILKQL